MGETAKATIEAVVASYRGNSADGVLAQFHDNVRVVGSKAGESWHSKNDVETPLREELQQADIGGGLAFLSEDDLADRIKPENHNDVKFGWVTEEGPVEFNGQTVHGRWTCIVQK